MRSYLMFHLWKQTSPSHCLLIWILHLLQKKQNKTMVRNSEAGFLHMVSESIFTFIIPLSSPFPLKCLLHNSSFLLQVCKPRFLSTILNSLRIGSFISVCCHSTWGLYTAWTNKHCFVKKVHLFLHSSVLGLQTNHSGSYTFKSGSAWKKKDNKFSP